MSFQFPDPSVSTTYTSPNGERWVFVSGAWEIDRDDDVLHTDGDHETFAPRSLIEEVDENEEQLQAATTVLLRLQNRVENIEGLDIQNALSALAQARQDIIELKSKVSSLELTSFLILE